MTLSDTALGTISFDLDGTLIVSPFASVLRDISAEVAGPRQALAVHTSFLARHEMLMGCDIYAAYDWLDIVTTCSAEWGCPARFDVVARLREKAAAGATRMLHANIPAVLTALGTGGWRTVILTNGRRCFQEPVLAGSGILAAADALVTSDDVGAAKPAPAIFAAARAGAPVHVHVGDRLDHDILGARSSGATSVLLRSDAPVCGITAELGRLERDRLEEYLVMRQRKERSSPGRGAPAPELVPDLVANTLAGAVELIDSIHS